MPFDEQDCCTRALGDRWWQTLNDLGVAQDRIVTDTDQRTFSADLFAFINWPTRYDNREATKPLKSSGVAVPHLETFAAKLWDYWERNLDLNLFIDRSLSGRVRDKVIVVTGASSGIGKATALKLASAMVARDEE
jgi:hypothetical protein